MWVLCGDVKLLQEGQDDGAPPYVSLTKASNADF